MPTCSRNLQRGIQRWDTIYCPKVEVTGAIPEIYLILCLRPCKQKEAEKVKSDTKQNGEEAMELDNREREAASEATA